LKNITDGCLISPIQADKCIDRLQSDQQVKDVVFEISSVSADERDRVLEAVSSIDNIESIYLLGKQPETKEERNAFFTRFDKVCIFCEDEGQLAVQCVLNMANNCRIIANECVEAGNKDIAREHFQRGMDLYDRLRKFIDGTRPAAS